MGKMKSEKNKRISFFIMGKKGYRVLSSFLNLFDSREIDYVVVARDENIRDDFYEKIIDLCKKKSIYHLDKADPIPDNHGYKFAIGWRWIINNGEKLIVLHDSILPKYRGFAPLVNMLIKKEREIGVTAIFASDEYDQGNIIDQKRIKINYPIRINEAIESVIPLYENLVNSISKNILNDEIIISFPQKEENATYSLWRDEKDYFIDWDNDSEKIRRTVDALSYPYDGAKTFLNDEIITIDKVEELPDKNIENRIVGKVIFLIQGKPVVVCKKGLLKIEEAKTINGKSIFPFKKFRSRFGK